MTTFSTGSGGIDVDTIKAAMRSVVNEPYGDLQTVIPEGIHDTSRVRNAEWLTITEPVVGDNKIVGLVQSSDSAVAYCDFLFSAPCTIDWGDGVTESFASGVDITHSFINSAMPVTLADGSKQCQMTITFTAPFTDTGSTLQLSVGDGQTGYNTTNRGLLEVYVAIANELGSIKFTNGSESKALKSLEYVKFIGDLACNSLSGSFSYIKTLGHVEFTVPQTNLTNLSSMFSYSGIIEVLNLSAPNVTNASGMFNMCESLYKIGNCNLPSATSLGNMFKYCRTLKVIDGLDLSSATDTSSLFNSNESLKYISNLDVSSTTNIDSMFSNCKSLVDVPPLPWINITSASSCFNNCQSIVDISSIDTSYISNLDGMFSNCVSITDASNISIASATSMNNMFSGCTSMAKPCQLLNSNSINLSAQSMFYDCRSLTYIDMSGITTLDLDTYYMFNYCVSLVEVKLPPVTSPLINTGTMFGYCRALSKVDGVLKVAGSVNVSNTFNYNSSLREVTIDINTATIGSILNIANGCKSLKRINGPLIQKGTSQLTYNCPNLETPPDIVWDSVATNVIKLCFNDTKIFSIGFIGSVTSQGLDLRFTDFNKAGLLGLFADLPTNTSGNTLYLPAQEPKANFTAGELLVAENKGWVVV